MNDTATQSPEASRTDVHQDMRLTIEDIRAAARRISGHVVRTDMDHSRTLSEICGCNVWLKFENLQFTAAYKERGALNALLLLTQEQRERGVIAASAGNHAQGLSYHGTRLGVPVTIVMPRTTPTVKVMQTESVGGKVVLEGETFDEAYAFARSMEKQLGLTFVHPFDEPNVAAGQGTVALEMLEDVPELDMLVIPVGGGGLASGMGTAARAIKPDIGLIGVEAELFPSMYNVLKGASLPAGGDTLAEGIAVKEPGKFTQKVLAGLLDDFVLVNDRRWSMPSRSFSRSRRPWWRARCRRPRRRAGKPRDVCRAQCRHRAVGRQHRPASAGQCAAARSGAIGPSGPSASGPSGPPRRAVQGDGGVRPPSGQHPRSLSPAHLHPPARQGPDRRYRMRGTRWRADRGADRGAAGQGYEVNQAEPN
jgi:threonine dehydratase